MKEQFDGICLNDDDMHTCVFGLRFQTSLKLVSLGITKPDNAVYVMPCGTHHLSHMSSGAP